MSSRLVKLLLGGLTVLYLFSCSGAEVGDSGFTRIDNDGKVTTFKMFFVSHSEYAPSGTRVATDDEFQSKWEDGDEVGIFAVSREKDVSGSENDLKPSGNYIHNMRLTYRSADNAWHLDAGSGLYFPGIGYVLDFYAYYPYSDITDLDPTNILFEVADDQSGTVDMGGVGKKAYNMSDLLWAKADNSGAGYDAKSGMVVMIFTHALSMLQVDVSDREINIPAYDDSKMSVKLKGLMAGCSVNLAGRTISAKAGSAKDVVMKRVEDGSNTVNYTYRALVPEQDVVPGHHLFSFTQDADSNGDYDGNGDFYLNFINNSAVTLSAGYVDKYQVKLTWGDIDPDYSYAVGDPYPHIGKAIGVVYKLGNSQGTTGKIVSLDEYTAQWCGDAVTTGATDMNDGKTNMDAARRYLAGNGLTWDYLPAFGWVEKKNQRGNHWFLPSVNELSGLYSAYSANPAMFNNALLTAGGTVINNTVWWSSTESADGSKALGINMATGQNDEYNKDQPMPVRAVLDF